MLVLHRVVLVLGLAALGIAHALPPPPEQMGCEPPGYEGFDCFAPCLTLEDGTVFLYNNTGAMYWDGSTLHTLAMQRHRALKRHPQSAMYNSDLPGDQDAWVFANSQVQFSVDQTVTSTTCYEVDEQGRWQSIESCCTWSAKVLLQRSDDNGEYWQELESDIGC